MTTPTTARPGAAGRGLGRVLRPMVKVLPEHARAHNRSMVLQHLFHAGPTSRADLARSTGLTRVTVSDLVAELIAEGLVEELGLRTEARVGKPATLVGMRTEDYQIVAIDLADDAWIRGAVMSLVGGVVVRRAARLDGRAGEAALDLLAELAKELLAAATRPVIGIGIGSPGVIDRDGVVIEAPNRDWYDVPLASILTSRLGVPVHVGNDANTRALGEYTYGGASGDGLLVLTVGQGVGAGIVVDGMLLTGHANAAGEVGHLTVVDERDHQVGGPAPLQCACGRWGVPRDGALGTRPASPGRRTRPPRLRRRAGVGRTDARHGPGTRRQCAQPRGGADQRPGRAARRPGPRGGAGHHPRAHHAGHRRTAHGQDGHPRRGRRPVRGGRARSVRPARGHVTTPS
ncbi:ROK family transcriptional regulator [Cellulomonas sp. P24]|uniref:ROK family transcriptional regulator n=1 Tax=Cellulomonas sp. P24 TaxID=2885206 RepID=UPI00286FFA14|nr:ROK family transcriptional regulator [Cellulomonas sp. P24]MCR6491498.1 ROK family transcriptional regulator [Cellulomonas sp. P24]